MFKVKHLRTSSYHPQSNSTAEVFNKTILQSFRLHCAKAQEKWVSILNPLLYSFRATTSVKSTQSSPLKILFHKPMRLVCDTAFLTNTELTTDADKFAKEMLPRVQLTETVIRENIKQSQVENKRYYDRGTAEISFEIGEKCWVRNMQRKVGQCPKMERPWIGPYLVVQKGAKGNYRLRHAISDIPLAIPVHVNKMKKYVEPYHGLLSQARMTN